MRKTAFFFTFTLLTSANVSADKVTERCLDVGAVAEDIMGAHQSGASLAELLAVAKGNKTIEFLVLEAADFPIGVNKQQRDQISKDFSIAMTKACMRTLRK